MLICAYMCCSHLVKRRNQQHRRKGVSNKGSAWRSTHNYKYKRSKTALLRALPIKFAVRIFPLGRKRVKFCGKRQCSTFYYLPQNEGKTTAERVGLSLKATPQNAVSSNTSHYLQFYLTAFSTGGEAKRTQYHAPYMRCLSLLNASTNSTA